jgi:hypothetical protein
VATGIKLDKPNSAKSQKNLSRRTSAKRAPQALFLGYFHLFYVEVVLKTTRHRENPLKPAGTSRRHMRFQFSHFPARLLGCDFFFN